jgi:hypothetical protein
MNEAAPPGMVSKSEEECMCSFQEPAMNEAAPPSVVKESEDY